MLSLINPLHADGSASIRRVCPVGAVSNMIKSYFSAVSLSVINLENSLNAAISTVHEPDNCSSIFSITESGSFSLYGAITLSLYSAAACTGSRFATTRLGTFFISTPLLLRTVLNTSCRLDAGSVLTSNVFFPSSASFTAVAHATDVLPTPPFPVKKIYFVRPIISGLYNSIIISPFLLAVTATATASL